MTIRKTERNRKHKQVRQWASKHKEQIYQNGDNKCVECKTSEDLTIHHKQYIVGYEFVELRCNKCHRNFHRRELRKRLLTVMLHDAKKYKDFVTLELYIKDLEHRIKQIPVEMIEGLDIEGLYEI